MNELIQQLVKFEGADVATFRRLYTQPGREYDHDGISIACAEIKRELPEFMKFTLGFPLDMLGISGPSFGIMLADYALRLFGLQIDKEKYATGKEKQTGKIAVHEPNQKIMLRNSSYVKGNYLYITLTIRFPLRHGSKREISGKASAKLIQKDLRRVIRDFLEIFDLADYEARVMIYQRQQEIRVRLAALGLIGFIANGSILPRDERGLALVGAIPFQSPPEDEIELTFKDGFTLRGMGIKAGVTVITGSGYSGKSTLLNALLDGIYDHIPGDGREYCILEQQACKIIAEDGRSVNALDISPFIQDLKNHSTQSFTTLHASGSTSQAANIMEAVSFGCQVMLIDEDRTATNFMIRDARMKKIIKDDPIVPFTDRVRQIYQETGVSTILVIGGSSEYLDLADHVYMMQNYVISNYNEQVATTRENQKEFFVANNSTPVTWRLDRKVMIPSMSTFRREDDGRIREFVSLSDDMIYVGMHKVNIARLATIVSLGQAAAVATIIAELFNTQKVEPCCLLDEVTSLYTQIGQKGLDHIYKSTFALDFNLEVPAMHDVLFALARMPELVYN